MTKSLSKIWLIYCPFANDEDAKLISNQLIEEKLIACANILGKGTSVYFWKDSIQTENEVYVIFKTSIERHETTVRRIEALHPYDTPAVISIETSVNDKYGEWVRAQTALD
jgi:periplasmic divalent cation tolerance protein